MVETFANFGVSKLLQSDNDKALVNETMEEVRKMAGFQFRNIMAYFPRQNGVVEQFSVEETKSLLKKVIRGDHVAWDVFIPAVQMAMNDRVLSRHGSRPFSVMFGRKMNGFDDYQEVSWDEKEGKEWLENAKKWGKDVWEAISLKGKNYGTEVCDKKNEVGLKSRKRRLLKVNDLVMRVIGCRNKLGERWEGPFVVIEYDKKVGGYKLQEKDGKVLKNFVPIKKLKLIEEFEDDEDQEEYEILEVLNHQGPPSK